LNLSLVDQGLKIVVLLDITFYFYIKIYKNKMVLTKILTWFLSLFTTKRIENETVTIEEIEETEIIETNIVDEKIEEPEEEKIKIEEEKMSEFSIITEAKTTYYAPKNVGTKYKNVTLEGMSFPDQTVNSNLKISMGATIMKEYYPIIKDLNYSKGLKLLAIVMANKEGFTTTSRSYKTNNPGNIGNTDSGANNTFKTLKDGIIGQLEYLTKVANNQHSAYKFGPKTIKPFL
jgi:hypothetical protein